MGRGAAARLTCSAGRRWRCGAGERVKLGTSLSSSQRKVTKYQASASSGWKGWDGWRRGAPPEDPEDREGLRLAYEDLRAVRDDDALATRCLGTLLNFADRQGKRLVLIVENLNMLLPEMSDPDAGWKLRKTLQTEPRITLLGSATSRFAEIDHPDHALYDIFTSIELRPLNLDECVKLWETVAGRPGDRGTIRAMQILTGGSPRMIAVVAGFRETYSFNALMDNLLELIDDHTEYFKGHIDALPAQERRVYLALARLWKPAETAEIADQARMDSNRCSAFPPASGIARRGDGRRRHGKAQAVLSDRAALQYLLSSTASERRGADGSGFDRVYGGVLLAGADDGCWAADCWGVWR